jgi:hypothetical protein
MLLLQQVGPQAPESCSSLSLVLKHGGLCGNHQVQSNTKSRNAHPAVAWSYSQQHSDTTQHATVSAVKASKTFDIA